MAGELARRGGRGRPAAGAGGGIDAYLARLPAPERAALERIRRTTLRAAPGATEAIAYGIPTIKHDGRWIMYFAAAKEHLAIYGVTADERRRFAGALAPFDVGDKGTVRFTAAKPLPASLVRDLVRDRLARRSGP